MGLWLKKPEDSAEKAKCDALLSWKGRWTWVKENVLAETYEKTLTRNFVCHEIDTLRQLSDFSENREIIRQWRWFRQTKRSLHWNVTELRRKWKEVRLHAKRTLLHRCVLCARYCYRWAGEEHIWVEYGDFEVSKHVRQFIQKGFYHLSPRKPLPSGMGMNRRVRLNILLKLPCKTTKFLL